MSGSGMSMEDMLDEKYEEGCEEGYRQGKEEKNMSETKEREEADMLSTDVKRIVAAMLGGFGIVSNASAAADNTAEVKERKGEEVSEKHGI